MQTKVLDFGEAKMGLAKTQTKQFSSNYKMYWVRQMLILRLARIYLACPELETAHPKLVLT